MLDFVNSVGYLFVTIWNFRLARLRSTTFGLFISVLLIQTCFATPSSNEMQKLLASDGIGDDRFGSVVSGHGNIIAVGAYAGDNIKGSNAGRHVWIVMMHFGDHGLSLSLTV